MKNVSQQKKPRSASSAVKQRQAHNVRTHYWAQDPLAARAPLYKERPCKVLPCVHTLLY